MQLVTLDFETYYDNEYTLSKMTTEEYVRDTRFKAHCLGVRKHYSECYFDGHDEVYETGERTSCINPISLDSYAEDSAFLCHHAHFDGLILSHHYGIKPKFWFDTLSMARLALPHFRSHSLENLAKHFGLGVKTVPYNLFKGKRELDPEVQQLLEDGCMDDCELTYQLFLKLLPLVPREELEVIDMTIRLFTEPALELNRPMLQEYYDNDRKRKQDLLEELQVNIDDLRSDVKFAAVLETMGVEAPTKLNKKDQIKFAFAKTDEGMKDLLTHEDERIIAISECRLAVKSTIAESRAKRMLDMDARGAMCVYLKAYGAHTLRWSGGDSVNWQNLTNGTPLRLSLQAPEGHEIVVVDKSQIECRLLNWLADEKDVLSAFADGRDLYCEAATRFYGKTITKEDKEERKLFKEVELGCGFGMGHVKFRVRAKQKGIIVTEAEAKELIDFYRHTHEGVKRLWNEANRVIQALADGSTYQWKCMLVKNHKVYLPNGSYLSYEGLYKDEYGDWRYPTKKGNSKIYGALLVENVVQALARVLLAQSMLELRKYYKIVMSTHDEAAYLAKVEDAEKAYQHGVKIFTTPRKWCMLLPLGAEGGHAKNYSK